jgi:hypothetical protein
MTRVAAIIAAAVLGASPLPALAQSAPAPGQFKPDYDAWVANPAVAAQVRAFRQYLKRSDADGVIPLHELLRSAHDWQRCRSTPFAVPPAAYWPRIARTLQLVRAVVEPLVGKVEVLSGYRDSALNACAGGAPASAHRLAYALDLVPRTSVTRAELIARLCSARVRVGRRWAWGLGFYQGRRFHVDTLRYRTWSTDRDPSPCAAYG